jgi:hypothetical protein
MIYAEASYAGPDMRGRAFAAHHFQHIADRAEHQRLKRIARRFGDPAKYGSTPTDTATLLWRLEANEALVGRKAA